jgi:hypothetical protein
MSTKFWLRPGQGILDLIERDKSEGKLPKSLKIQEDHDTGEQYIELRGELHDPTSKPPQIPAQYIDRVTFWDVIYRGFGTDGIYREETGVEMLLLTQGSSSQYGMDYCQELRISAPSLEALLDFHLRFRNGDLKPVHPWEDKPEEKAEETKPAE